MPLKITSYKEYLLKYCANRLYPSITQCIQQIEKTTLSCWNASLCLFNPFNPNRFHTLIPSYCMAMLSLTHPSPVNLLEWLPLISNNKKNMKSSQDTILSTQTIIWYLTLINKNYLLHMWVFFFSNGLNNISRAHF